MYWDSVPVVTVVIFGRLNDSNYKREEHKYNKLGYWRMREPDLDCVGPGELGGVVLHVVVAGFLCVEGVGHGDGLVRSVTGSRVDASLSNSGLTFVAAAASMADFQQAAGAIWNWLAAVHWLDSRLHLFKRVMPPSFTSSAKQASRSMSKAMQPFCFQLYSKELYQKSDMKL